jgi:hypothetical protein
MAGTDRGRRVCSARDDAHRNVQGRAAAAAGLVAEAAQLTCAGHLSAHRADWDNAQTRFSSRCFVVITGMPVV